MDCKRKGCGVDIIHYHAPTRSKKVLVLGMDKLDEDKISPMSFPWEGYWQEAPISSHWVMTSQEKGGTYEMMKVESIVKGFIQGDITFTKGRGLRMKKIENKKIK